MDLLRFSGFLFLVVFVSLATATSHKVHRKKRVAELAEILRLQHELHRTKRVQKQLGGSEKTLSRVKRLDDEKELQRVKRQKRHAELIQKAFEHIKRRSIPPEAELKELLRIKRTKRHAFPELLREKRQKMSPSRLHKREKKSISKRSKHAHTKKLLGEKIKSLIMRKKRNELPHMIDTDDLGVRTDKKDYRPQKAQRTKKHHVQRHKKSSRKDNKTKGQKKKQKRDVKNLN